MKKKKLSIEDELTLLIGSEPDIELKEPIAGSQFLRKGLVECISVKGYEHLLQQGNIYSVNELHVDGSQLEISCLDGRNHWLPDKLFKGIDYGPFLPKDQVHCNGFEGAKVIKLNMDLKDLIGIIGIVTEATDTTATVTWGDKQFIVIPNENLKLKSRLHNLPKNPFKQGDKLRCIVSDLKRGLNCGWTYTVKAVDGGRVYINEMRDRYFNHTNFVLCKLKEKKKTEDIKKSLEDYIRQFINTYSTKDLTPKNLLNYLKAEKLSGDEFLNEEQITRTIKIINDNIFHWR